MGGNEHLERRFSMSLLVCRGDCLLQFETLNVTIKLMRGKWRREKREYPLKPRIRGLESNMCVSRTCWDIPQILTGIISPQASRTHHLINTQIRTGSD
jgi:hypothetical protein